MEGKIKTGDVVTLKSGSPDMVVVKIGVKTFRGFESDTVQCQSYDLIKKEIQEHFVSIHALIKK